MPDGSVDLTVTSPPYDNLRNYQGYSFPFEQIADELYRVTKDGGVVVWIVKDTVNKGNRSLTSFRQCLYFQQKGFNIYDVMIYYKRSGGIPNARRYTDCFEYMFILSKGRPKSVNKIKDRKNLCGGQKSGRSSVRGADGVIKKKNTFNPFIEELGYRYNLWDYATGSNNTTRDKIAFTHPAIFPEKLAYDHIISWSQPDEIVYDPFMGSGTVAKMCVKSGRKYIGSEISQEYCSIAESRITGYTGSSESHTESRSPSSTL